MLDPCVRPCSTCGKVFETDHSADACKQRQYTAYHPCPTCAKEPPDEAHKFVGWLGQRLTEVPGSETWYHAETDTLFATSDSSGIVPERWVPILGEPRLDAGLATSVESIDLEYDEPPEIVTTYSPVALRIRDASKETIWDIDRTVTLSLGAQLHGLVNIAYHGLAKLEKEGLARNKFCLVEHALSLVDGANAASQFELSDAVAKLHVLTWDEKYKAQGGALLNHVVEYLQERLTGSGQSR